MNSTPTPIEPHLQDQAWRTTFVICVVFVTGACGVIFNGCAMFLVLRNPRLRNSFGALCFSHSIANLGVLSTFIGWVGPLTILQDEELSESYWGRRIGQINIIFWDVCVYSHLAISINRMMSVAFPTKTWFYNNPHITLAMIAIVWSLGLAHGIPYIWLNECYIEYSPISWTWNFAETECGMIISTYFDYYTGVGVFTIIFCIDFFTLFKLRSLNNVAVVRMAHASTTAANQRRKAEIRFFAQTCVQGTLFFYELLNFYFICTLWEDGLAIFMTSTFAWEVCHALDGFVVVLFQFRDTFKSNGRKESTLTVRTRASRTISGGMSVAH